MFVKPFEACSVRFAFAVAVLAAVGAAPALRAETVENLPETIEFNRDIRPILSNHCFACHGPDKGSREAGLRLDTEEGALAALDGGHHAVVPGEPAESEVYRRITAEEESERMPPKEMDKDLTARQIALIERWIEQGASWQGHWAYVSPKRPEPPVAEGAKVEGTGVEIRNAIDSFVLDRLRSEGVEPSPEADRRTLIRRLSFDLTGLPPTPEEIAAFEADRRPDAYERLVDRLLASPRYGERMAMHWLDLVRYADSVGYHGDQEISIWPYRDYVINAFNDNMPFDRFTTEQLAGDLLPDATRDQEVAAGYNRLNMMTAEGGAQAKEYLAIYAADRVRTTTAVWMGATVGCAECHDHKFDPYTAKDFYRFAAFFADIKERGVYNGAGRSGAWGPQMAIPSEEQAAELERLDAEIARLDEELNTPTPELAANRAEWERSLADREEKWDVLRPERVESEGEAEFELLDDGSILVTGGSASDTYTLTFEGHQEGITGVRLEALPDESLPQRGPGRAGNGNFVLNEFGAKADGEPVEFSRAAASHSQDNYDIAGAIDGDPETGWAILEETGRPLVAVFETSEDIGGGGESTLTVTLHQNYGGQHTIGRLRISTTTAPRPVGVEGAEGLPEEVAAILSTDPEERTDEQDQALAKYYRSIAPELEPQRRQLAELKAQKEKFEESIPTTLVVDAVEPREMRVLPRGNWMDDSGEVVQPGVPHFLPQPEIEGDRRATRLDLAKWLVHEGEAGVGGLTARVFVNRLWSVYFGDGISRVLDDLGGQGEWPEHPALLDWLAVEFVESGWDVKHIVKTIVMSRTYRQSSMADDQMRETDPYNRLLARQSRFRLDAEMVRDNALAISGLLSPRIGGPSVKPYQPAGYYAQLNFPKREYQQGEGEDLYRRGLYTHWQRTFLHPSLAAFDAPSREECTVQRPRSNTPTQALVLLNDPTYVEAARVLAERVLRESEPGVEPRIQFAFGQALAREANPAELELLASLHRQHLEQYRADPSAADALIRIGERPAAEDLDAAELAAWTSIARVILNLHETITRN